MRRVAGGIVAVLAMGVGLTAGHAQDPLPACPNRADLVWTYPPDYLRVGQSLTFSFERDNRRVESVRVRYPTPRGAQEEDFRFDRRSYIRVIRPAPGTPRRFGMTFRWVQNAGRESACRGTDTYRGIPIVPRDARVGDPRVARFAGRYRTRYSTGDKARWRLRPRCDYFGCKTKLKSKAGLKANFRPRRGNRYRLYTKEYAGYCEVTYLTGATRRYNVYHHSYMTLRVTRTRVRDGLATRLSGERRAETYAEGRGYDICRKRRARERVHVVREG